MFRHQFQRFYSDEGGGSGTGTGTGTGTGDAADAVRQAQFERDTAKASATKLAKEIEELKKGLPSEEQRQRWSELEKQEAKAEEERQRKAGEFDQWRRSITEKHEKELTAREKATLAEQQRAGAIESELNNTLIGLSFASVPDLFGPKGSTVLLPAVAQSYFGSQVLVVKDEQTGKRSVEVRDDRGNTMLDPKTGRPMAFAQAMEELIAAHPDKEQLLRGSGKVGSGSAGGVNGGGASDYIDPSKLTPEQRRDPKVLERLRAQQPRGGQIGGRAYQ